VACSSCETLHHQECWQEAGGVCTTYACGGRVARRVHVLAGTSGALHP
jgi:hypothetical protein